MKLTLNENSPMGWALAFVWPVISNWPFSEFEILIVIDFLFLWKGHLKKNKKDEIFIHRLSFRLQVPEFDNLVIPWTHDILFFLNFGQGCTNVRLIITLESSCTWFHWKYYFETGNLLVFIYYPETFFCDWKPISPPLKPWASLNRLVQERKSFFIGVFQCDCSRSSIVFFTMHLFQSWAINFNY